MFFILIISLASLIWVPNVDAALDWTVRIVVFVFSSYGLYFFIQKYNLIAIIANSVLVGSYINYSLAFNLPVFSILKAEGESGLTSRFQGTEINPNFLAVFLVFSVFISLLYFQQFLEKKQIKQIKESKLASSIHLGNVLLALYTIVLTASRKGLIASILLIGAFFIINLWKFAKPKTIIYLSAIIGVIIVFWGMNTFGDELALALERNVQLLMFWTSDGGTAVGESVERRSLYIERGWEGFIQRPLFGHGLNAFQHFNGVYAHNNYVELLFDLGFFGFIAYYSIHLSLVRKLRRNGTGKLLIAFVFILIFVDIAAVSFVDFKGMLMLLTAVILANRINKTKTYTFYGTKENRTSWLI